MLSDALAVGMGLATVHTAQTNNWTPVYVGALAYVLGGPAIHGAHDRPPAVGWSLGRRVLLPLGGALLGVAITGVESCSDYVCARTIAGFGGGLAAGMGAAMVFDWATARSAPAIASNREATPSVTAAADESTWARMVLVGRASAGLGLAGRF